MKHLLVFIFLFLMSCDLGHYDRVPLEKRENQETQTSESFESSDEEQSSESQPSSSSNSATSNDSTIDSSSEAEPVGNPDFQFDRVMITEVVTDPQSDHGESLAGNGIVFDSVAGTGTVGSTDEYIEIYNGTTGVIDVSAWTLVMLDGTDETQVLSENISESFFSLDGSFENFSTGEFLVFGNPSGALNNAINIQLYDEEMVLIDEVFVDDANASGLADEAYYLGDLGVWEQGVASPGGF